MTEPNGRERGTVKFFNAVKGWGMITPERVRDDGKDIFIHNEQAKAVGRLLEQGDPVSYITTMHKKGPRAFDVVLR